MNARRDVSRKPLQGIGLACLLLLPLALPLSGCRSTPTTMHRRAPSILEQTVTAMDEERWEDAESLLDTIVPEPPEEPEEASPADAMVWRP